MTVLTEPTYRSAAFIVSEAMGERSREAILLAQSPDEYLAGTVLKEDGGEYVRFDGAGDPVAILTLETTAVDGPVMAGAIVRDAEVTAERLWFPEAVTDAQRTAAFESLETLGVIVRDQEA